MATTSVADGLMRSGPGAADAAKSAVRKSSPCVHQRLLSGDRISRRRGATAVEFAMIAPVVFLFLFGLIEFGRITMVRQAAVNASREGCRTAVLGSTQTGVEVDSVVRDYLKRAAISETVVDDPTSVIVSVDPPVLTGLASGAAITVDVQFNVVDVSWMPGDYFGFLDDKVISASATMNRE